jgi:hypothetical protein
MPTPGSATRSIAKEVVQNNAIEGEVCGRASNIVTIEIPAHDTLPQLFSFMGGNLITTSF